MTVPLRDTVDGAGMLHNAIAEHWYARICVFRASFMLFAWPGSLHTRAHMLCTPWPRTVYLHAPRLAHQSSRWQPAKAYPCPIHYPHFLPDSCTGSRP